LMGVNIRSPENSITQKSRNRGIDSINISASVFSEVISMSFL
jgi:hypothetical protein